MNLNNIKKALILAPHTDDGELGCGGTICKLLADGVDVYYVAFSACEQSVLPHFPKDILISEVKEATKILGIRPENLFLLKYPVRMFTSSRQAILDDMIKLRKEICPDVVFIPSMGDIHQDHGTIASEALRAFKFDSILSYELPWNNLNFVTNSFVYLSEEQVSRKILALSCYKSQMHRSYANEEFIRSLARTRGVQIDTKYAEVFEVVRWIIK
jgi:LmbE family N-acetylglucosaminyl deacetylase